MFRTTEAADVAKRVLRAPSGRATEFATPKAAAAAIGVAALLLRRDLHWPRTTTWTAVAGCHSDKLGTGPIPIKVA